MRGPLVYCAEQTDNPGDLWNYRLADGVTGADAAVAFQADLLGGVDSVDLPAVREHEVRHCAWKSSLCVDAHSVTIPEKHCNIKGLPVRHCAWAHAQ